MKDDNIHLHINEYIYILIINKNIATWPILVIIKGMMF